MTNEVLVSALVKLRHRINGLTVTLTRAEAQSLYLAVLRHATAAELTEQEHAEQMQAVSNVNAARAGHPLGVAAREALGWPS